MHNLRRIHHNLRVGRMMMEKEESLEGNPSGSSDDLPIYDNTDFSFDESEGEEPQSSFTQRFWDKITNIF